MNIIEGADRARSQSADDLCGAEHDTQSRNSDVREKLDNRPARPKRTAGVSHIIGSQLKTAYDEIVHAPVPDKFIKLLEELEAKTAGTESESKSS